MSATKNFLDPTIFERRDPETQTNIQPQSKKEAVEHCVQDVHCVRPDLFNPRN